MNFYRPTFKDRKTGALRETERWYIDFRDHHGTRQRFAGDADKHTTADFSEKSLTAGGSMCRMRA